MLQDLLTASIVGCCAAYVVWALLLPATARRHIAMALLRHRWPDIIRMHLQVQVKAASGCHCHGCDRGAAPPPAEQPVHWAPRRRR